MDYVEPNVAAESQETGGDLCGRCVHEGMRRFFVNDEVEVRVRMVLMGQI